MKEIQVLATTKKLLYDPRRRKLDKIEQMNAMAPQLLGDADSPVAVLTTRLRIPGKGTCECLKRFPQWQVAIQFAAFRLLRACASLGLELDGSALPANSATREYAGDVAGRCVATQ